MHERSASTENQISKRSSKRSREYISDGVSPLPPRSAMLMHFVSAEALQKRKKAPDILCLCCTAEAVFKKRGFSIGRNILENTFTYTNLLPC